MQITVTVSIKIKYSKSYCLNIHNIFFRKKNILLKRTGWVLVSHLAYPSPENSDAATVVFYFNAAFPFGRQIPQALEDRKY